MAQTGAPVRAVPCSMEATATVYSKSRAPSDLRNGPDSASGGVETVGMVVNLLLLRGNIGRRGAGICPVRGHSNVQVSGPSALPKSRPSCRWTSLPSSIISTRPASRDTTPSRPVKRYCGQDQGFRDAGRQFRACHPGSGSDGAAWRRMRLTVNVAPS